MITHRSGKPFYDRRDHYQEVTDKIIAALESGTRPWQQPWRNGSPGMPVNAASGRHYHGINVLILGMDFRAFQSGDPRWMTYQQALEKRWQVRKGERSTTIFFTKPYQVEDEEADEGSAAGEVEGAAEDVSEDERGEDDFGGVGEGDTKGEGEAIAVEDVGEGVGEEADSEVLEPEGAGAEDDQGEEHAVGEPDGGNTIGHVGELDAEPGEEEEDEEGEGEIEIARETTRWREGEGIWSEDGLERGGRDGLSSHG